MWTIRSLHDSTLHSFKTKLLYNLIAIPSRICITLSYQHRWPRVYRQFNQYISSRTQKVCQVYVVKALPCKACQLLTCRIYGTNLQQHQENGDDSKYCRHYSLVIDGKGQMRSQLVLNCWWGFLCVAGWRRSRYGIDKVQVCPDGLHRPPWANCCGCDPQRGKWDRWAPHPCHVLLPF